MQMAGSHKVSLPGDATAVSNRVRYIVTVTGRRNPVSTQFTGCVAQQFSDPLVFQRQHRGLKGSPEIRAGFNSQCWSKKNKEAWGIW